MQSNPSSFLAQRSLGLRAQAGDKEAYDQLFALAAPRLQLFIRVRLGKKLREKLDSLDVLHEAYIEADKALHRFVCRDEKSFGRWLCCIAENKIRGLLDHYQAKKRTIPGGRSVPVSHVLEQAKSGVGPLSAAAANETRDALEEALEKLDDELKSITLLRHFQGLTISEISELTSQSKTQVRRLIGRAQLELGRLLREGGHSGE